MYHKQSMDARTKRHVIYGNIVALTDLSDMIALWYGMRF